MYNEVVIDYDYYFNQRGHTKETTSDCIQFLIDVYTEKQIDLEAWNKFTAPISGVDFDSIYGELMVEKRLDEEQCK
jgi:hypothetical protein